MRRVVVSPQKSSQVNQCSPREIELMRKLSILEGRVGELHKEKHEIAARLNEENRKIYHENTSLQIKINELSKVYEKSETARQSPTERVRDSVSIAESHTIVENEGLKGEIEQLETLITS